MGTTKTALQAGSLTRKFVIAIEGYSKLISDSTEAKVQTAWAGTDWASNTVIGGLTVQAELEQSIDPWDPFANHGGTVSFSVKDSIADTFGIDTHREDAGDETQLAISLDSNDTTVSVASTTGFASSGEVHIGTECIGYSSVTATTFAGATRGKYSPFGVDGGTRFGRPHRVRNDPNAVTIKPLVTEHPRAWAGRYVGVWMHRESAGVLDVKAEAQCIFAGRIVEVRDDPETMSTVVECEHILGLIAESTLGREMFQAEINGGVRLYEGNTFSMIDTLDFGVVGPGVADDLTVVASGASGHLEVNAGRYSNGELRSIINTWLSGERAAGNLDIDYEIALTTNADATVTRIWWYADGTAGDVGFWRFTMPLQVARFLGFDGQGIAITVPGHFRYSIHHDGQVDTQQAYDSNKPALRSMLEYSSATLDLLNETGAFADQYDTLPAVAKPITSQSLEWGVFVVDDEHAIVAAKSGAQLTNVSLCRLPGVQLSAGSTDFPQIYRRYDEASEVSVRQIFVIEAGLASLLKQLYYSSGTAGYNHATFDTLPFGVGLNCPGGLLGDTFEASIDSLPAANMTTVLVIDKPTRFAEEMSTDLVVRWAFPVWKDQALRFMTWPTPVAGIAVATLTEATKAAPARQVDNHRTASTLTDQWARPVIKWEYDRNPSALGDETYRSSAIFEDPTAIDDAGGTGKPLTLKMRNVYSDVAQTGGGVSQLIPTFLDVLPMFSRGSRLSTRSIAPTLYETLAPGDVVLVTDEFARDPSTGARGISRAGAIVSHRWQPGGGLPGQPSEMSGEVTIMFLRQNRIAAYVPCAQVDDTAATAGYVAGTKTLTCYAHKHSESSEAADASYFPAGAKVRVIEIDPVDPASPLTWDDTVASQTGNTIVLTTGLAGWDTTKRYRVISDDYGDATATQQTAYAYQADDADGLVGNARAPYQYAYGLFDITTVTENSTSDMLELPPNGSYGDSVGRDIGHEAALNRLATSLIDFRTAPSMPTLSNTAMTGAGLTGGTRRLVEIRPVFLGADMLLPTVTRNVSVSTFFRSSDGASASVRITLAKRQPQGTSLVDVDRGTVYSEQTFTTTSTTWAAATATDLTALVKDGDGQAWLLVEVTEKAETRGVCKCQVSARVYS